MRKLSSNGSDVEIELITNIDDVRGEGGSTTQQYLLG